VRGGTSGGDAGRPVVESDIREIPSQGRAATGRVGHRPGDAVAQMRSGALGPCTEMVSENRSCVVRIVTTRRVLPWDAVAEDEEDRADGNRRRS